MTGACLPGAGRTWRRRPRARPGKPPAGWARLAVSHVGICGTDYHIFEGKHPFLNYPRVMGHEVSATVIEAGDGVDLAPGATVVVNPYLACGKCIACRNGKPNCCTAIEVLGVHRDGAMCEQILVPASNLYPADGLSPEAAATVEFLAIGAHAVRRAQTPAGARSLVIGAGPIGLGTAIFSRIAGHEVTLLDMSRERLDFATRELGFALDRRPGRRHRRTGPRHHRRRRFSGRLRRHRQREIDARGIPACLAWRRAGVRQRRAGRHHLLRSRNSTSAR